MDDAPPPPPPPDISTLPSAVAKSLKMSEEKNYKPLTSIGARDILRLRDVVHIGWLRRRHEVSASQRVSGFAGHFSEKLKQKISQRFHWKLCYVVLHNGCVYCFSKETSNCPNGTFSLEGYKRIARACDVKSNDVEWAFKVIPRIKTDKTWYFSAGSQRELILWMAYIKAELERIAGKEHNITDQLISDITCHKAQSGDDESLYGVLEESVYEDGASIEEEENNSGNDYEEPMGGSGESGEESDHEWDDDDDGQEEESHYNLINETPEPSDKYLHRPLPVPPGKTASLPGVSRSWEMAAVPEPSRERANRPPPSSRPPIPASVKPATKPAAYNKRSQSEEHHSPSEKEEVQGKSSRSYKGPPGGHPGNFPGIKVTLNELDRSKLKRTTPQYPEAAPKPPSGFRSEKTPVATKTSPFSEKPKPSNFRGGAKAFPVQSPPYSGASNARGGAKAVPVFSSDLPKAPPFNMAKPKIPSRKEFDVLPDTVYYVSNDRNIEQLLMKHRVNGMYALRNSSDVGKKVLVVWLENDGRCRSYKVFTQQQDLQFSLGPSDVCFQSMRELILHYYKHSLPNTSGHMLTKPYPGY